MLVCGGCFVRFSFIVVFASLFAVWVFANSVAWIFGFFIYVMLFDLIYTICF